jgi:hypothetical protein
MILNLLVAAFLMAGAEVSQPSMQEGWVLWVETTGIRTIVDEQKKTHEGREPVTWSVDDGYESLAACRAAIAQKFKGLPVPDADALMSDKPLPRVYVLNSQSMSMRFDFANGEKLSSIYRHLCLPGTVDPRERGRD